MTNPISENAKNLNEVLDFQEGGIVSKSIVKRKGGNITLFAFDKGQQLSEHTAAFDALLYVSEGSARVTINQEPYEVDSGNFIILPANISHAVDAISSFKMLLVMIKS